MYIKLLNSKLSLDNYTVLLIIVMVRCSNAQFVDSYHSAKQYFNIELT